MASPLRALSLERSHVSNDSDGSARSGGRRVRGHGRADRHRRTDERQPRALHGARGEHGRFLVQQDRTGRNRRVALVERIGADSPHPGPSRKGSDALLEALRDAPRVGYFRTPNNIGYDLHFARALPGDDGGRRIILATDRPILFWEARNQPRSIDYPFTVIELRLNADGEGEGKMSIAAKISGNKALNLIDLEDYASQPVRLLAVRSERRPT